MAEISLPSGVNPDQLNGWKDIAAYVGKSVRGAQRWEHELGLPVHRIKTPGGQVIYALKSEIEHWKLQAEGRLTEEAAELSQEATATRPRVRLMAWGFVLSLLGIVFVAVATVMLGTRPAPEPVRFVFSGNKMDALDRNGRLVWSFDFGRPERPLFSPDALSHPWPDYERVRRIDVDEDGQSEVLVALPGTELAGAQMSSWSLYALSSGGRKLWDYSPDLTLSFAGRAFEGPWQFTHLLASPEPGPKTIWLSAIHNNWWPSFIVRLDARGAPTMQFVSSGHIYGLTYWRPAGTGRAGSAPAAGYVIAAGINNEYGCAALAVLEADGSPSVSPQSRESAYAYDGNQAGRPLRYFLFPRSEMSLADDFPYNRTRGGRLSAGQYEVFVDEMPGNPSHHPGLFYQINPRLDIASVAWSDGFEQTHRRLEREGALSHTVDQCPERTQPKRVRVWDRDAGWTEQVVPVVPQSLPGPAHAGADGTTPRESIDSGSLSATEQLRQECPVLPILVT